MKVLCVFGKYNYGDPARGLGYEYANFIPALKSLGHEVFFFECLDKSVYRDYSDLNRNLLGVVERVRPDVIIFVLMGYEIWTETLQLIREGSRAALVLWSTDDSWKYEQFSRFMAPLFDVYATTYPSAVIKAELDGIRNCTLTQWAADSARLQDPLPGRECRYKVSFIGTAYGNRMKWVEALARKGVSVDTFGHGWPSGAITPERIMAIMRESYISLNFGDSGIIFQKGRLRRSRQIKARIFEVPGAGGLLLTEDAEHLKEFFESGREIVVYDGVDDLVSKIDCLLNDSARRDAIAKAGHARVKKEHTYEARFAVLLERALKNRIIRPGNSSGIEFGKYSEYEALHRANYGLRILRRLMLIFCVMIWGKRRGPRAARRILFEISWRLFGAKTYSAKGWPGKLFYEHS